MVNVRSLIDDVINPALRGVGTKEILSQQENRLTLHQKIVEFLTSLPNIDKTDALRALLYSAGLDQQLHDQIEVAGPPAQFFQLLVSTLSAYGTLEDGRNPLKAILESAKGSVGQERRAYCDALIQEIEKIL